jgi:hypothetical protein
MYTQGMRSRCIWLSLARIHAKKRIVIPANAGIHFDFDLGGSRSFGRVTRVVGAPAKIKMDPSVRWDDVGNIWSGF